MKNLEKSKQLYNEYKQYFLNVTPLRTPIMARGKGTVVWDVDGNSYIDMMSGQFCLAFGHTYAPLNRVITKQLSKIVHTNTLTFTEEALIASKELASIVAPPLKKSILLSTGAEAVECALRYAKFVTKRTGVVGITSGYHGLTLATQSISTGGIYAAPKVHNTFSIPSPDWLDRPDGVSVEAFIADCLAKSRELLAEFKGTIAAFVIEPVISVGGMIYPPKSYFEGLRDIAKEHGALLVFDECQTGLGRTGTWFGYEHYGLVPDILVLAKIAGAGLPVSAVVMTDQIAEAVEGKFIHFSSHQNDPLSGAILTFVIRHMKEKNILASIRKQGAYILKNLEEIARTEEWLEHPRGTGLMHGFDLPQRLFKEGRNPGTDLIGLLERRGIIIQAIRRGRTVRILPSYLIKRKEIDMFASALKESLQELHTLYEA